MLFNTQYLILLAGIVGATPIPANRVLQAQSSVTTATTPTFSTITPTYTPIAPIYKREKEIKIMFNNKREIENAANVQKQAVVLTEPTGVARRAGSTVGEYQLS